MSFSHLYNITKQGQYGASNNYDDEDEYNMGAYGDDVAGSYKESNKTYTSKYDDAYDSPKEKTTSKNADPFEWGNTKPSSQKFEYDNKDKQEYDSEEEDTGYDGWNDVKKGARDARNKIPDPYSKPQQKSSKYDPYPEDDFFSNKEFGSGEKGQRGKATTVVNKGNDYFSSNFDNKNKGFDEKNQPKAFDFNDFGNTIDKKNTKNNDFDNVFDDKKAGNATQKKDDPFSWDNETQSNTKQQKGNDFDFDFNGGNQRAATTVQKKSVADFLDEQPQPPKKAVFDPFADQESSSNPADALADIKFEAPPPTELKLETSKSADPRIETENEPQIEEKRDPEDLWSKKELFNLNNLSKSKQSRLEIHKDKGASGFGKYT